MLQTVSTLLSELKFALDSRRANIQVQGESIHISLDECGACFANTSYNWNRCSTEESSRLLVSLLEAFKTCSVGTLERKLILEAFFLANQFENAALLAGNLDTFCNAFQELFTSFFAELDSMQHYQDVSPFHFSLHRLKSIVALARSFMQEFESIILLGDENIPMQQGQLHMASMVFSEVSQNTLNSLMYKTPFLPESTDASQQRQYQKETFEEFSLVLSLKDAVLSSFPTGSSEHSTVVKLIGEIFPRCDLQGLLAHESYVREGLEVKSRQNKEAAESARESRAASAMQMVHDDLQPHDSKF